MRAHEHSKAEGGGRRWEQARRGTDLGSVVGRRLVGGLQASATEYECPQTTVRRHLSIAQLSTVTVLRHPVPAQHANVPYGHTAQASGRADDQSILT